MDDKQLDACSVHVITLVELWVLVSIFPLFCVTLADFPLREVAA